VVGNTSIFIDFIGVQRFDWIVKYYLVNLFNCMKIKETKISSCSID